MNREGVNTIYKEHFMIKFSGKVDLVILSIFLFIINLWFFLYTGEAEEMKESTLKINKRDCIL